MSVFLIGKRARKWIRCCDKRSFIDSCERTCLRRLCVLCVQAVALVGRQPFHVVIAGVFDMLRIAPPFAGVRKLDWNRLLE